MQNIDLMNLAGFCRNCLSNWMKDAADAKGVRDDARTQSREVVYGMPYEEWRAKHQQEASASRRRRSKKQATSTERGTPSCALYPVQMLWMIAGSCLATCDAAGDLRNAAAQLTLSSGVPDGHRRRRQG